MVPSVRVFPAGFESRIDDLRSCGFEMCVGEERPVSGRKISSNKQAGDPWQKRLPS
jgi:hypothetical protein